MSAALLSAEDLTTHAARVPVGSAVERIFDIENQTSDEDCDVGFLDFGIFKYPLSLRRPTYRSSQLVEESEFRVMKEIITSLESLPDEASRARVIRWALDKLHLLGARGSVQSLGIQTITRESVPQPVTDPAPANFADFFARASPQRPEDKALLAGYWYQVVRQQQDFDGQTINRDLRDLGHGIDRITNALDVHIRARPQLIMQTKKSGTSRQARKRYRVTMEGIRRVEQILGELREAESETEAESVGGSQD